MGWPYKFNAVLCRASSSRHGPFVPHLSVRYLRHWWGIIAASVLCWTPWGPWMQGKKATMIREGSVLQAQSNSSRARSASISDRKRGKLDQASNPGRTTSPTSRSRRRARSRRSSRNPGRRRTRTRRRSGSRSSSKSSACKRDELLWAPQHPSAPRAAKEWSHLCWHGWFGSPAHLVGTSVIWWICGCLPGN